VSEVNLADIVFGVDIGTPVGLHPDCKRHLKGKNEGRRRIQLAHRGYQDEVEHDETTYPSQE
jgi:hypothetical protein